LRRFLSIAIVTFVIGLAEVLPANALNNYRYWGPLTPYEKGSRQGAAKGSWRVTNTTNGTRVIVVGSIKDYYAGGDSIYWQQRTQTNAGFCLQPSFTSCGQPWYDDEEVQSARSNSSVWVSLRTSTGVDQYADYARGLMKACEDQRWSPDPCTGWLFLRPDTY